MAVSFSKCQNVKMIPFDVVASCFNVVSNSKGVITFHKGLKMFYFLVTNVKIIAVPAAILKNDWTIPNG